MPQAALRRRDQEIARLAAQLEAGADLQPQALARRTEAQESVILQVLPPAAAATHPSKLCVAALHRYLCRPALGLYHSRQSQRACVARVPVPRLRGLQLAGRLPV